jgi:large subunit ribosomal protein L28
MAVCENCGKRRNKSNKISFSNKHHRVFQQPNLQRILVLLPNGAHKRLRICTSCIRANKVRKAG